MTAKEQTIQIPLTNSEKVAIVDESDYWFLSEWNWFLHVNGSNYGYAECTSSKIDGSRLMQRQILGVNSRSIRVGHIDHNSLNNSRSNIWMSTPSEITNASRPRSGSSSKYKGVCRREDEYRDCWEASITLRGKVRHIGNFDSELEAALARDFAAKKYLSGYAHVNCPDITRYSFQLPDLLSERELTSSYRGVFVKKSYPGLFSAGIQINSKKRSLGVYLHEREAALAYDIAAREEFGSNAKLNFPDCKDMKPPKSLVNPRLKSSKYRGVSKVRAPGLRKTLWQVLVARRYIGCFEDEDEAARAYDRAATEYFGEYASLNFEEVNA